MRIHQLRATGLDCLGTNTHDTAPPTGLYMGLQDRGGLLQHVPNNQMRHRLCLYPKSACSLAGWLTEVTSSIHASARLNSELNTH